MIYVVRVELDVDCGKEDLLYFEDTLNIIYTSKPTYDDLVADCIQGFFSDVEKELSKDYEKFELAGSRVTVLNVLKDNVFAKRNEEDFSWQVIKFML